MLRLLLLSFSYCHILAACGWNLHFIKYNCYHIMAMLIIILNVDNNLINNLIRDQFLYNTKVYTLNKSI